MRSKDYMKKTYENFSDFVSECSSKELEYFIFDSKFTTAFNERISEIVKDIEREGKKSIEFAIMFNTEGEIALIDSYIIGNYIGNNYRTSMEKYYKKSELNKIIKNVVIGSEKSKKDFLILSYNILYSTLQSIYCDVKCKKETVDNYKNFYNLQKCDDDNYSLIVVSVLILEDICKYMGIEQHVFREVINYVPEKRSS